MKGKRRLIFTALMMLIVGVDQVSKYLTSALIKPYESVELLPVLNLVNVHNKGAAFGMFSSLGNTFFIVISFMAIIFIAVLLVKERDGFLPLTFILAGAAGNLADRLAYGYVRDFIDVFVGRHHWPAFNVADSALTIGITLMIVGVLFNKGQPSERV